MIQVMNYIFGENIESVIIKKEDEINRLADYFVNLLNSIEQLGQINFQNNSQGFIYHYGTVYIDKSIQIEEQFKSQSPFNYARYKQKIEMLIAKKVRQIAKKQQKVIYQNALQTLKSQYKQIINIPLKKLQNVRSLFEQYQQQYQIYLQNIYNCQPKTMKWILIKFEEKMKKDITYQLIEQQKPFYSKENKYKTEITNYIHTFLITSSFWILNKDSIKQLIQFVHKQNKSTFQDLQYGAQRFIMKISNLEQFQLDQNDLNEIFSQKNQKEKQILFFEKFNEEQTIQLIIEIFILFSGFKFENNYLFIEKYQTTSHAFLLKLLEQINDGKWNFTNSQILKLAYKVMGDIHYEVIKQLNEKQTKKVQLNILNGEETIEIFGKNQKTLEKFQLENSAYYFSSNYSIKDEQQIIDQHLNKLFSTYIDQIVQLKPKDLEKYPRPEMFYLQSLSTNQMKSNVITIFVNGFTTQNEQNDKNLWPFNESSYLETLVLGWKASTKSAIFKCATIGLALGLPFGTVPQIAVRLTAGFAGAASVKASLQFIQAYPEAKKVGKYLAYFLNQNYLGIKAINLIGFSLGTVIVFYCLKQLIKLQKEQNQDQSQLIHNVLMMGGVADKQQLQKLDFRCISGTFHNVYSDQDWVLSYFLPVYNKKIIPCGLNPIYSMHPNVKNHNFSKKVSGHLGYEGEVIKEILKLTNFDDQYLIF